MATKTTFEITTPSGSRVQADARTSKKLARLIVTKSGDGERWTITHKASGWAMTSLLPLTMRNIAEVVTFAEALEVLEHPAWKVIDSATPAQGLNLNKLSGRDKDHLRDFASKARQIGIEIAVAHHSKRYA